MANLKIARWDVLNNYDPGGPPSKDNHCLALIAIIIIFIIVITNVIIVMLIVIVVAITIVAIIRITI